MFALNSSSSSSTGSNLSAWNPTNPLTNLEVEVENIESLQIWSGNRDQKEPENKRDNNPCGQCKHLIYFIWMVRKYVKCELKRVRRDQIVRKEVHGRWIDREFSKADKRE